MKTILLWDPRFPDRRPARLTVEDTVASAAVRAGVAAAANPAEAGALSAGGALDPTMLTEVVIQHGSGNATRRVFLPYSVVMVGAAAGVLASIGTPIPGGVTPTPTPTPTLTLSSAAPSIASNAAAGTLVSNISNVPAGATPTVTPNDGRLVIAGDASAGWKVVVGMSALSAGTINFSVAATGATGVSGVLTVAAASGIVPAFAQLGTIAIGAGSADARVFEFTLPWKAGLNADFSNLRIANAGATALLPFYIDPDSIVSSTSAQGLVRLPSTFDGNAMVLPYDAGATTNLSDGAATADIFLNPEDTTLSAFMTPTIINDSFANTQKGVAFGAVTWSKNTNKIQDICMSSDGVFRFIAEDNDAGTLTLQKVRRSNNAIIWTMPTGSHGNGIDYCPDADVVVIATPDGDAAKLSTVVVLNASDGTPNRILDCTGILSGVTFDPSYAGPGKLMLRSGQKFFLVGVDWSTGAVTLINSYVMPASSGFPTPNGGCFDWDGSAQGDGVPAFYYQGSGGSFPKPTYIFEIVFPTTTTAAIRRRYGPFALGDEAESLSYCKATGEWEVGYITGSTITPAGSYVMPLTFTTKNSRFNLHVPKVTGSSAILVSNVKIGSFVTNGVLKMRARLRWSNPYDPTATAAKFAFGVGTAAGETPGSQCVYGQTTSSLTLTQANFRAGKNGGTSVTGTSFTVPNHATEKLTAIELRSEVSASGTVIAQVNGAQVSSYTAASIPIQSDFANMRVIIKCDGTNDTAGLDAAIGPVPVYQGQITPSIITVS